MKESKSRPFLILLFMHVVLGFVHLLVFNLSHPLFKYTQQLPVYLQVPIISAYALVLYIVVGNLLMIALDRNSDKIEGIDRGLILFTSLFIIVFAALFVAFLFNERQSIWLVYSLVNPLFGTAMYNAMTVDMWNLLWGVSAFIPGIGTIFGMYLSNRKRRG